jgi:hypothetical protein
MAATSEVALAVGAIAGPVVRVTFVAEKGRDRGIGADADVSALPAITSVGTTFGSPFAAMKRRDAGTAVASFEVHTYAVDEHRRLPLRRRALSR